MSGTDVFISYARPDRPAARVFAESLIEEGFNVWWDGSLHSGETFDEVIEQKLRDAKAVVVLWSPRSVVSRWVRAEATLADRRNKLVPAIIEACDRPIIFELTHTADLCEWQGDRSDANWRALVDDLNRLVQASVEQQGADAPQQPQAAPQWPASALPTAPKQVSTPRWQPQRPRIQQVISADEPGGEHGTHITPDHFGPSEVHCLEMEDGELAGELIVVDSAGVKIGRSPPADIVLSHKSISREHCIVSLGKDGLLVTDLESTNGTYIDEERISRAILPVGSVVRLGQISLRHAIVTKAEAVPRERTWFQAGRIIAA